VNSTDFTKQNVILAVIAVCAVVNSGCQLVQPKSDNRLATYCDTEVHGVANVPRELDKATAPMYRIEPPDILTIDVEQQVSQKSHLLRVGDVVSLNVPDEPVSGEYRIEAGGAIELGYSYGTVDVAGTTIDEAAQRIESHLLGQLRDPQISMSLRGVSGVQQISGEHLVGPDGTVTLGQYGSVGLAGMTLEEARYAIAGHLSDSFVEPNVSVSVFAFNSKAIYIVTQGGGLGDNLVRLPYTGNETVMDALSQINGLSYVSSSHMWVARPNRVQGHSVKLPIDWEAMTQDADVSTNYQLLPGDRLFIAHNRLVAFDTAIAKITSPLERILGVTLLGTGTTARLSGNVLENTNIGIGF